MKVIEFFTIKPNPKGKESGLDVFKEKFSMLLLILELNQKLLGSGQA